MMFEQVVDVWNAFDCGRDASTNLISNLTPNYQHVRGANFLKTSATSSFACYLFLIYLTLGHTLGLANHGLKDYGLFTTEQDMDTKYGTLG
jgi:hypothetical protein